MCLDMVLIQILLKTFHFLSIFVQYHKVHNLVIGSHQDVGCHIIKLVFDDVECLQIISSNLKSIICKGQ
jgi:hypothetical protein